MALDLTPLLNAVAALERALDRHHREPADEEVRDSVIQRFEFTYDLSHKMLRRVLSQTMGDVEELSQMSFPTLIRTGWEQGLVPSSWPEWEGFRKLPNITSHTYDPKKAVEAAALVPAFLGEVRDMSRRLQERVQT